MWSPILSLIIRADKEADEFKQIRISCIPEVILAYNTVLNYSAFGISRDILLKCMNLASVVAAEDSDLTASFIAAGRMPELVESFALSSRSMILAEEMGHRSGKSRRKPNGERLDLWTIKPPSAPAETR
jgi:nuclear pore complex protein Nup107